MAVFSTLKILENTKIRKIRKLAVPGDVLVKQGDDVEPDTVIARAEYVRGNPYFIDLAGELRRKITPELVDRVLLKKVGDKVKAKEVIGRYQKSFWSDMVEIKSPCDGVIEYISRVRGWVIIREDPRSAKPMSVVPVSSKLGIWPRMIRMYAEVKEGDVVKEGQVIAAAPGIGTTDFVYSPISGIVEKVCSQTGTIVIVRPIKPTQVLAHIAGTVTEIIPDQGAVVEAIGSQIEGIFGIGQERFGELQVVSDSPAGVLEEAGVEDNVKGKILVAGGFATLGAIQKARSEGAVGLIVGGLNQLDLVKVLGKELFVGITGQEEVDFTVIILEGFGVMPMNEKAWQILDQCQGRIASIDGTTQIRAGVVRPEILISRESLTTQDNVLTAGAMEKSMEEPAMRFPLNKLPVARTELCVGDRVRCTRAPYFGLWGVVEEVLDQPEPVECEALMEVVRVRLDDNRLVTVPEANLEVFREKIE